MARPKVPFTEYLIEFRNTRVIIHDKAAMKRFSDEVPVFENEKDMPNAIYTYGFNADKSKNNLWLVQYKDGMYATDFYNNNPASFLLSDVEYELAKYAYGEGYYYEPKYNEEQIKYLREVQDTIRKFNELYDKLNALWTNDPEEIDMHEFLEEDYPFTASFDELDILGWKDTVEGKIEKAVTATK